MAYNKSYDKMSISSLKKTEFDIIKNNPDLENRLKLFYEEQKRVEKRNKELKEEDEGIKKRIAEINKMAFHRTKQEYQQEYDAAGFFKKFFMGHPIHPRFTEHELTEIHELQIRLDNYPELSKHPDIISRKEPEYLTNKYISAYDTYCRLSRIRTLISKKQKREKDKAVLAAFNDKSRDLANLIKSDLREQINIDSHCPYCGEDMGDDPHCDHIYPVSKGGLSTPHNMVYVCSECNMKKTNLTLTQFIKRFNFQRLEIESRLEKLGKDY